MELGAGRKKKEDSIDSSAGIVLQKKAGDPVREGERIATLYSSSEKLCENAERIFVSAVTIRGEQPARRPLVFARVTKDGVQRFF
jgi:pyrimidine-nucleoside phosphorylase